jgi:hypothetical protein
MYVNAMRSTAIESAALWQRDSLVERHQVDSGIESRRRKVIPERSSAAASGGGQLPRAVAARTRCNLSTWLAINMCGRSRE